MSLDYYIEKKQLLEWPAYNPDLNPIENVWANIKYKFGGNAYQKIQALKSDIKEYWISCAAHLSSICCSYNIPPITPVSGVFKPENFTNFFSKTTAINYFK